MASPDVSKDVPNEGGTQPGRINDADAQSLVAVAISPAQARLASPDTPATEKAAALENGDWGGYFDIPPDTPPVHQVEFPSERTDSPLTANSGDRWCEPAENTPNTEGGSLTPTWRPNLKSFATEGQAGAKEARKNAGRLRAYSGPSALWDDFNSKRLAFSMPSMPSLPSLPKVPSLTNVLPSHLPFLSNQDNPKEEGHPTRQKRPNILLSRTYFPSWNSSSTTSSHNDSSHVAPLDGSIESKLPCMPPPGIQDMSGHNAASQSEHPRQIRKVASDNSLEVSRSFSRVSSLGDDTRFESVQGQVNSRFKAIKDSFADSSFKRRNIPNVKRNAVPKFDPESLDLQGTQSNGRGLGGTETRAPRAVEPPVDGDRQLPTENTSERPRAQGIEGPPSYFDLALEKLTGDVVIMGGYRGSILRSAQPPHKQLWAPVKIGLNLRKVDLEVGLNPEDEESMEERIFSSGMLTHVGPVDISRRLLKRLRHCENAKNGTLRVHDYGYDWRLSPHLLSRKLEKFLEGLPSNGPKLDRRQHGALLISHSLGGLITRHMINRRPDLVSGVIYAGVPQSCVNILGPLRNGDDVLLSSKVLTAQVNFTFRTSFVFLPESGSCFINKDTKEEYRLDFFNVQTWIDHRLSPCVCPPLPTSVPQPMGLTGLVSSVSSSLPNLALPGKKAKEPPTTANALSRTTTTSKDSPLDPSPSRSTPTHETTTTKLATAAQSLNNGHDPTLAPQMGSSPQPPSSTSITNNPANNPRTTTTLPPSSALTYLQHTLNSTLLFKHELSHRPALSAQNAYPPAAVLYGKSVPTVRAAKVASPAHIARLDAYSDLAFASGDGVALARESMLPPGYALAKGGRVSSERGHVTLLGDLEGVGRCLLAVIRARREGVGTGRAGKGRGAGV
ncbi:MAG: hypothetical protein M1824_002273 [Vezdaea acicularis]|nr:MAG: hypothetical protein M1824_002273 [Vezdaea acicularis]